MKQVILASLKINIVLALLCFGLLGTLIYQSIEYTKLLEQQKEIYKELVKEEQIILGDFPNKKLGRFTLSWYSPKELGKEHPSQLRTSKGAIPKEGRTIAVDPSIIPYGSLVYIQGYGYFIAEDCGGAIKGNRIDIFTSSYDHAIRQGKKKANVWLLETF